MASGDSGRSWNLRLTDWVSRTSSFPRPPSPRKLLYRWHWESAFSVRVESQTSYQPHKGKPWRQSGWTVCLLWFLSWSFSEQILMQLLKTDLICRLCIPYIICLLAPSVKSQGSTFSHEETESTVGIPVASTVWHGFWSLELPCGNSQAQYTTIQADPGSNKTLRGQIRLIFWALSFTSIRVPIA